MRNLSITLLAILSLSVFSACETETSDNYYAPSPDPAEEAAPPRSFPMEISSSHNYAEPFQAVTFRSQSEDATTYQWSVNGALLGTEETLEHKFVLAGSYTVKLTAKDNSDGVSTQQLQVIVGDRHIEEISITSFPTLTEKTFDQDGSGPDLFFQLSRHNEPGSLFSDDKNEQVVTIKDDLVASDFPLSVKLEDKSTVVLESFRKYEMEIRDNDGSTENSELIKTLFFTPVDISTPDPATGKGIMTFEDADYKFSISYQVKAN